MTGCALPCNGEQQMYHHVSVAMLEVPCLDSKQQDAECSDIHQDACCSSDCSCFWCVTGRYNLPLLNIGVHPAACTHADHAVCLHDSHAADYCSGINEACLAQESRLSRGSKVVRVCNPLPEGCNCGSLLLASSKPRCFKGVCTGMCAHCALV